MPYSGQPFDSPKDALAHFGVKGMRWGFRKKAPPPTYESTVDGEAIGSPIKTMDKTIHTVNQDAAYQVSAMLKERYGYEVTELRAIEQKRQFKNYIAYVEADSNKGTIHVQPRDMNKDLGKMEKSGWFGKDCGNIRAVMTHETAHSMFHAEEKLVGGMFTGKIVGGNREARDKALDAAVVQANKDGIKTRNMTSKVSGYTQSSIFREEFEAEMFSQYHWRTDAPAFVKTWGETLHKEMGVDPTPFREVVKDG